ncbi:MAG: hypothetical protein V1872_09545 [bacterium]
MKKITMIIKPLIFLSTRKKKVIQKKNNKKKEIFGKEQFKDDIYVTKERFEWANDKIQEDMNRALSIGATAIDSFNFLVDYLIKKKIIDAEDIKRYIKEVQESLSEKSKPFM